MQTPGKISKSELSDLGTPRNRGLRETSFLPMLQNNFAGTVQSWSMACQLGSGNKDFARLMIDVKNDNWPALEDIGFVFKIESQPTNIRNWCRHDCLERLSQLQATARACA